MQHELSGRISTPSNCSLVSVRCCLEAELPLARQLNYAEEDLAPSTGIAARHFQEYGPSLAANACLRIVLIHADRSAWMTRYSEVG